MGEAYIVAAARTAGGKRNGKVSGWHPADLAAVVLDDLVARAGCDPALVEDVIMGCVIQAGEQSQNIARGAVLASHMPRHIPGVSIDRQCGSSQQALHFAAATVMAGVMDCVIAAGRREHDPGADGAFLRGARQERLRTGEEPAPGSEISRHRVQPVHRRRDAGREARLLEGRDRRLRLRQPAQGDRRRQGRAVRQGDHADRGRRPRRRARAPHGRRGHPLRCDAGRRQGGAAHQGGRPHQRGDGEPDLRRRLGGDGRQRARPEGARRRAAGAHPPHDDVGRRSRHHAGGAPVRHRQGARNGPA